eukprot:Blabericola_migrator_1__601@NODE_1147_length_5278_cov_121_056227_g781_i0_p1_GENE_NODE_1147_length_5278_cov_121_056227_g781_i0NODE_1147_length_5278_cov_121_056227_g781_i0_p1_ORF_typecomplete_len612_score69_58BTB/PF00651_31/0_21_NODE_1147_length_5278_cov_121_056227_g781_i09702805
MRVFTLGSPFSPIFYSIPPRYRDTGTQCAVKIKSLDVIKQEYLCLPSAARRPLTWCANPEVIIQEAPRRFEVCKTQCEEVEPTTESSALRTPSPRRTWQRNLTTGTRPISPLSLSPAWSPKDAFSKRSEDRRYRPHDEASWSADAPSAALVFKRSTSPSSQPLNTSNAQEGSMLTRQSADSLAFSELSVHESMALSHEVAGRNVTSMESSDPVEPHKSDTLKYDSSPTKASDDLVFGERTSKYDLSSNFQKMTQDKKVFEDGVSLPRSHISAGPSMTSNYLPQVAQPVHEPTGSSSNYSQQEPSIDSPNKRLGFFKALIAKRLADTDDFGAIGLTTKLCDLIKDVSGWSRWSPFVEQILSDITEVASINYYLHLTRAGEPDIRLLIPGFCSGADRNAGFGIIQSHRSILSLHSNWLRRLFEQSPKNCALDVSLPSFLSPHVPDSLFPYFLVWYPTLYDCHAANPFSEESRSNDLMSPLNLDQMNVLDLTRFLVLLQGLEVPCGKLIKVLCQKTPIGEVLDASRLAAVTLLNKEIRALDALTEAGSSHEAPSSIKVLRPGSRKVPQSLASEPGFIASLISAAGYPAHLMADTALGISQTLQTVSTLVLTGRC